MSSDYIETFAFVVVVVEKVLLWLVYCCALRGDEREFDSICYEKGREWQNTKKNKRPRNP